MEIPSTAGVMEVDPTGRTRPIPALEMQALIDRAEARLAAAGAGPGVIVQLAATPTAAMLASLAAIWRLHATALVTPPAAIEARLTRQLRSSPWRAWPVLWNGSTAAISAAGATGPGPSYLLATGGSTGAAKLVPGPTLGPAFVDAYRLLLAAAQWRDEQRQLVCGPLYHAAPLLHAAMGLLTGNTVVLLERFDGGLAVGAVKELDVEWCQLTPYQMQRMAASRRATRAGLASLHGVLHTAAACPEALKRLWIDLLGPDRLFEMYSSSEAIGTTLVSGREWLERPGTVGRGFATQLRILDDAGRTLPPGEVGTVFMRSSRTTEVRALAKAGLVKVTPTGFATVGDRGYVDRDGYLFLKGRTADVANVGGTKVDLQEVATTLMQHPDVIDAVVLAVPDRRLGQRGAAWVAVRPGAEASSSSLKSWCRRVLPGAALPRTIAVLDELPRTAAGKLDREALLQP